MEHNFPQCDFFKKKKIKISTFPTPGAYGGNNHIPKPTVHCNLHVHMRITLGTFLVRSNCYCFFQLSKEKKKKIANDFISHLDCKIWIIDQKIYPYNYFIIS